MKNKIKVVSFFSGIGGFDLGFERAGMEVVFQCEINSFCQKVLKKHWPNVPMASNINDLKSNEIPDSDLWCGGFPCQDLSLANQGKRRGLNGERSGLFFKFRQLLEGKKFKKPKWIVLENVPGLLNSSQGKDFQVVLKALDELGYGLAWRVLDAKFFGTPQRRRRIFIVGHYRTKSSIEVLFDEGIPGALFEASFRQGDQITQRNGSSNKKSNLYVIQHATIGRKHTAGPQAKGYRYDGEAYTLDSRGGADVICKTNGSYRIREASGVSARLDSNRYRSIGNAVSVYVAEWLGKRIVAVDTSLKTDKDKNKKINTEKVLIS